VAVLHRHVEDLRQQPNVRLIVELDSGRRSILSDPTQDAVDRFGRSLFYVDGTDGVDVGEEMLRASWANVFVFDQDFQRLSRYRAARTEARDADAGVWGLCDGDFHRTRADELRERRLAAVAFMRRYYTRVTPSVRYRAGDARPPAAPQARPLLQLRPVLLRPPE
jgi:hypothetical protein